MAAKTQRRRRFILVLLRVTEEYRTSGHRDIGVSGHRKTTRDVSSDTMAAFTMNQLARRLRTVDYFTLGFGTMVGVGWLILMDDWLQRGGPLGGILGFLIGATILLPVAYVYGRLVMAIPDAGSE